MKKVFILFMLFMSGSIISQEKNLTFGVKVGVNYGDNGLIEVTDLTNARANDRIGYHLGVFLKKNLTDNIYIKPELQYTLNNSNYSNIVGSNLDYNIKKLDLPILLGVSLLGPIHIFGGPALQHIIENELENIRLGDVRNKFTVGTQFGLGIQFETINLDIRYERGLSPNRAASIDNRISVDSRPNQVIFGLAINL